MKLLRSGLLLLALLVVASQARAEELTTWVDRNLLKAGETLLLTVRWDGRGAGATPDFSILNRDFEILQPPRRSSHQSFSLINGARSAENYTEYTVTLEPRHTGRLLIPAFSMNGKKSSPIQITVEPLSGEERQLQDETVFFITQVDAQSIYVQSQLHYTVKLFYAIEEPTPSGRRQVTVSGKVPPTPQLADAVIESFGVEKRYQANRNQRRYSVLEWQYLIFPQKSGILHLPPEHFSGEIRLGYGNARRVRAQSQGHSIQVRPKPASYPDGAAWLPARKLHLKESFDTVPPRFAIGEPITRSLKLSAEGILGTALPELPALRLDQARTYADPPRIDEESIQSGIRSQREESTGIVPVSGTELILPEVSLYWWDTQADELKIASLPLQRYQIRPAPAAAAESVAAQPEAVSLPVAEPDFAGHALDLLPWLLPSHLLLILGWLTTVIYYRRSGGSRKSRSARAETGDPDLSGDEAFNRLKKLTGKPAQFRTQLIRWSRLHSGFSHQRHSSLGDLARAFDDPELTDLLGELDQSVHGALRPDNSRTSSPDCKRIIQKLDQLTAAQPQPTRQHSLAPLNPV